jgi:signal transduction histidine kinase
MREFLRDSIVRINAAVDWFIPDSLKSSGDMIQGVRMFLFSHLFGPFLGHTISLAMLYMQGGPDLPWWIFVIAVTAFWPLALVLRVTGWYVPLALISIENLMFCIFWGCYQYGGASSPIMPWLITVPLLAFFYLPERKTRIAVGTMIAVNLAGFYAIYAVFGFPSRGVPLPAEGLVALGLISTFCAGVYVSMMALYYASIVSSQAELEQEVQRHKETEQQLRGATEQAERAMQAKAEFLAKLSHELRNPLNSIIGYSEMLLDNASAAEQQRHDDLTSIKSAGHRLLELINDLLDLSKLEAGKMELHVEQVELDVLFDEISGKWRPALAQGGNDYVAPRPPAARIACDAQKLRRVIENLLSNAAKFTKNGSVAFTADLRDGVLLVSVADTGAGIADEQVAGLFETFGNSDDETASNYADDVRLGLPLAQRYCHLMGGELSVESQRGVGSKFTIRLPVRSEEAPGSLVETAIVSQAA